MMNLEPFVIYFCLFQRRLGNILLFLSLFIDDNLVATINQVLPYMTVDNITCGADNGIHGGIKDVVYKDKI